MLHGNPTWSFMYRRLIGSFRDSFRCIAFDHLGMGLSSRTQETLRLSDRLSDFEALMEALVPSGPVNLIGHDWGGTVATAWAERHPERVSTITLMNTGLKLPMGVRLPKRLALFRTNRFLGKLLAISFGLFTGGLTAEATVRPLSKEARAGFLAPYRLACHRKAVGDFIQDIPLQKGHPSRELLEEIDGELAKLEHKPALLIWGLKDFVFSPEFLYDLKKRLPLARSLGLPRSGHWLLEDEPGKIIETLENFLNQKH
jgi:haloalkane dehalogenase